MKDSFNYPSVLLTNVLPGRFFARAIAILIVAAGGFPVLSTGVAHPGETEQAGTWSPVEWVQSWFGWYYPEGDWIRHAEHGLLFPASDPGNGGWSYDPAVQHWLYFSEQFFPTLYVSGNREGWYFYLRGGAPGGRYFYAYTEQEWLLETALLAPREMVFVEGDEFFMQDYWSDTGEPRGEPRLTALSNFEIGRTELTLEKWTEVREWAVENGYEVLGSTVGIGCADDHPVVNVNWYDAVKWCNARSEMEGLVPVYYLDPGHQEVYRAGEHRASVADVRWNANGYRLPTEAEWEFAAKGGKQSQGFRYSGSDDIDAVAWYGFNSSEAPCNFFGGNGTFPVASKAPNSLGIYNMSGNAQEWVWDNPGLYAESASATNPRGPAHVSSFDSGDRMMRGGGFNSLEEACEVTFRRDHSAGLRINRFGFRLARSVEPGPGAP
ncbi:MAG TPA: SUMF1/EgtB/PvdO family nonheme iron enzyme [Oceanipulchritudo sp.]|nr:SUMF1/EgtB/PvdO family nonheme iron enzyme [Oceanipulchritudo sp.]